LRDGPKERKTFLLWISLCLGGEIGRRTGLKILGWVTLTCQFDSGPRHHHLSLRLNPFFLEEGANHIPLIALDFYNALFAGRYVSAARTTFGFKLFS
jgi:hypothetical protein